MFVRLTGSKDVIGRPLNARMDHYLPASLLDTQISTLEPPEPDENVLSVVAGRAPAEQAAEIIDRLALKPERRERSEHSPQGGLARF
jgi:gluconokinase